MREQEMDRRSIAKGQQWIRNGHATLTPRAAAAYLSLIAYYTEYASQRISGSQIEETGRCFAASIGLPSPLPALPAEVTVQLNERR
jgi:hypothetical protein